MVKIALAALFVALGAVPASQAASSLPGNATSLTEAHGDWTVRCGMKGTGDAAAVACQVVQQQLQKGTNQRILTLALDLVADGSAKGTLVMPFGLALAKGVRFQLDDSAPADPLPFRTCLPAGCLVSVNWAKASLDAVRNGKTLHLTATGDDGTPANFAVSLSGFGDATDRARALAGP